MSMFSGGSSSQLNSCWMQMCVIGSQNASEHVEFKEQMLTHV